MTFVTMGCQYYILSTMSMFIFFNWLRYLIILPIHIVVVLMSMVYNIKPSDGIFLA